MRRLGERLLFVLAAAGCLTSIAAPSTGRVADSRASAIVIPARTSADAAPVFSGPRVVFLPSCQVSDAAATDQDVFASRNIDVIAPPHVPVHYTLATGMMQPLMAGAHGDLKLPVERGTALELERPRALVPLYLVMTSLQALDVVSTRRALRAGGREANPMVTPVAGSAASMIALKAGASGLMVYAVERLWKQNRKVAVLTLVGTNLGYGALVAHNFSIPAAGARPQ